MSSRFLCADLNNIFYAHGGVQNPCYRSIVSNTDTFDIRLMAAVVCCFGLLMQRHFRLWIMVRKKKAQQLVLPKMHAALHCKAKIIIKSGFSGIIGAEQP